MRVVAIHQPNYLPWLGFFHKAARADLLIGLDTVQFTRGGVTNRNLILGPQGPLLLTVPVTRTGGAIRELEISPAARWQEKHYRSFAQCYRRAPFWGEHEPFLRSIYLERRWQHLADLNEAIIRYLLGALGIPTPYVRAAELGVDGGSTDLLVGLTRAMGGTTYLSGPSGREYLDESRFAGAGLGLAYHDFVHPVYPQGRRGEFVPNLSAFDLLLWAGPGYFREQVAAG